MYQFKTLEGTSWQQITECFLLAFSDYYFPANMTALQLQKQLEKSGADLTLSFGAFEEETMVGFIFNACSFYNGEKAVFDVGTGVVPAHRGNHVFSGMFRFALEELSRQKIDAYYLEVLQQNEKAVAIYQRQGFLTEREYLVLKAGKSSGAKAETEITDVPFPSPRCLAENLTLIKPCFEHSTAILERNPQLSRVCYIQREETVTAFCVYAKDTGAVLQLGYESLEDVKQLIQQLALDHPGLVVKNLDCSAKEVADLFFSLGFQELTKQYEMKRPISRQM